MNLNRLSLNSILIFGFLFSQGCVSKSKINTETKIDDKLCYQISLGDISLDEINLSNPDNNAVIYNCSISLVIGPPSKYSGDDKRAKEEGEKLQQKQINFSNSILQKKVNWNYIDENGNTLIMNTILSYSPNEWIEKTVLKLIDKGVPVNVKNNYGLTAKEYAKNKNLTSIIDSL